MLPDFSSIEEALAAIARGEMVIVIDAEDRENEGDFICAAEKCTPEIINFMLTHGRGWVCMPMLPEAAERLKLPREVEISAAQTGTPFTIAFDHRTARTGITAQERSDTVLAAVDPTSKPTDFVRPGHVHGLIAKEGGVLRRAGHTEATVDLARLAGCAPAGVLCEILDPAGNRATRDYLRQFAVEYDLPIITIEELIRYRRRSERLVERIAEAKLPTRYGEFRVVAYEVKYEAERPIVLVMGDLHSVPAPLVRVHSSCFTGDVLDSLRCDCGDQLHLALEAISAEGVGVLVYLQQEGRGIGLVEKIRAYALQDKGLDTIEANEALGFKADARDYGIGIQLLKDLGLTRVRILTNNPKKIDAFSFRGFELEVVEQVPITAPIHEFNRKYLATKRDRMGHSLPLDPPAAAE